MSTPVRQDRRYTMGDSLGGEVFGHALGRGSQEDVIVALIRVVVADPKGEVGAQNSLIKLQKD